MTIQIDSSLNSVCLSPNNLTVNLKHQLKYYLELRNITAAELSRKTGVSKQVLSLWLSGAMPKKIDQIKAVAEVLGVTIDHLCFGKGIDQEHKRITELDALLGDGWIGGQFEVRFRRIKRND